MKKKVLITVGIIEDRKDTRIGIQDYINSQPDMRCVCSHDSVEKFLSDKESVKANILILDNGLPGMSGSEGIRLIKEKFPAVDIIMLTIAEDPEVIFRSLCSGASGYLLKTSSLNNLKKNIVELYCGGAPMTPSIARMVIDFFSKKRAWAMQQPLNDVPELTERQKEVIKGLLNGLSYKMIADQMNVTVHTVQFHIKNIYRTLQVNSKQEALRKILKY